MTGSFKCLRRISPKQDILGLSVLVKQLSFSVPTGVSTILVLSIELEQMLLLLFKLKTSEEIRPRNLQA